MKIDRPLPMTTWGKVAFAVLVLMTLALTLLDPLCELSALQRAGLIATSVVYVALCCFDAARDALGTGPYLVLQHVLGLALPWLGLGRMAMAGLAVLSHSALVLRDAPVLALATLHGLNVVTVCMRMLPGDFAVAMITMYVVAVLFVIAFTRAVVSEIRTHEALDAATRQLSAYAAQAEELATTSERTRIARELHDSLGHVLTTAHLELSLAERDLESAQEKTPAAIARAQRILRAGLDDLRKTVRALHHTSSEAFALDEALSQLAGEHQAASPALTLRIEGKRRPLPPHLALALYRIAQEGLTNVIKHAQAQRCELVLAYHPHELALLVRDDGVGLLPTAAEGFGLRGIRERAALLGGSCELSKEPGLALCVRVPIAPDSARRSG